MIIETFTVSRPLDGGSFTLDMTIAGNAEAFRARRTRDMLALKTTLTQLVLSRRADLVRQIDRLLTELDAVHR